MSRPASQRSIGRMTGTFRRVSLVKSSGVMALGTMVSRVTGMLRSIVLAAAIGQSVLGNAYQLANTLPNTVYDIAVGGILSSVIVPLLVTAAKRDADRGERYTQRMFTLVTLVLFVVTLAATLGAGQIGTLFGCGGSACSAAKPDGLAYHHVLVVFSYFFIPQIFFYGVSAIAGAVLNARDHFAAPMWTPVINNIVVIVVTAMFMLVSGVFSGSAPSVDTITPFELQLLGVGTTLGIVAQTAALIPVLRRVGFRWRPRFDFRRANVAEIGRMGGWMFVYIIATQVAFLVTMLVTDTVNDSDTPRHGYFAYISAWTLFHMPYAIIAASVITALLPRMSASASERRYDLLRADFSTGIRLSSVLVAPAALVLAAVGPAIGEVLYAWGVNPPAAARYAGLVFSVFALGLMPYSMFQLLLRVFYSLHDSKTPALIGLATMTTNATANLIALAVVPKTYLVATLGIGFGLANLTGALISWRVLSRRLHGLGGRVIAARLTRMHAAAIPAGIFALLMSVLITDSLAYGKISAFGTVVVGIGGGGLIYLGLARMMRVTEVTDLVAMVRSRINP